MRFRRHRKTTYSLLAVLLLCSCADKTNTILQSNADELKKLNENISTQMDGFREEIQKFNAAATKATQSFTETAKSAGAFFSSLSPEMLERFTSSMENMVSEIEFYRSPESPLFMAMDAGVLMFTMAARMEKKLGTATEDDLKVYSEYIGRISQQMSTLSKESNEESLARLDQIKSLMEIDDKSPTILSYFDGFKSQLQKFNTVLDTSSKYLVSLSSSLEKFDPKSIKDLASVANELTKKGGLLSSMKDIMVDFKSYGDKLMGTKKTTKKEGTPGQLADLMERIECHSYILANAAKVNWDPAKNLPNRCKQILNQLKSSK